jgi:hypothetical protein
MVHHKIDIKNTKKRFNEKYWLKIVEKNPSALRHMPKQSEKICKVAIKKDYRSLEWVNGKFRTLKMYKFAVGVNGNALRYVYRKKDDICQLAVRTNPEAIKYINECFLTEKICITAVEKDPMMLQYVKKYQTPQMCLRAVKKDGRALKYVLKRLRLPKICYHAVKNYGHSLIDVPKGYVTYELCKLAVMNKGLSIDHVPSRFRSYELCKLAVMSDSYVVACLMNPSYDLCKIAVKKCGISLRFIRHKSHELCKLAVENDYRAICFVDKIYQNEQLCICALEGLLKDKNIDISTDIKKDKTYINRIKANIHIKSEKMYCLLIKYGLIDISHEKVDVLTNEIYKELGSQLSLVV